VATDPVKRIRAFERETDLALSLSATLQQLAALPPSVEAPYLTVSLDWRPMGNDPGQRLGRQALDRLAEATIARYWPRGTAFDSVSADLERIKTYLDDELDPATQGVVIVACAHQGVFEPVPLDLPIETGIAVGPTPSLRQLVHAAEDYPPYAVLVADQRNAILWLIERRTWGRVIEVKGSDYPRKQQQGGWSQRRFQSRADERVDAFARTVAAQTQRALDEEAVGDLIVAGDEIITSALDASFHPSVKERLIGTLRLAVDASEADVLAATEPLIERREREQELVAVETVRDAVGAGGRGAAGAEAVLTALQAGQVMTLVMNDDFSQPGWVDFTFPLYGVGEPPAEHPAGGAVANLVAISLEDELVRLAVQTGAEVDLIRTGVPAGEADAIPAADTPPPRTEAARALDELGGVGAVLRFTMNADASRSG